MEQLSIGRSGKGSNKPEDELYQGDMKLSEYQKNELIGGLVGRKGTTENNLWPGGRIYYKISNECKQYLNHSIHVTISCHNSNNNSKKWARQIFLMFYQ